MKQFIKRAAMVFGLLCTALLCLGIVYIDNISHYWRVGGDSGQYVQLIVSNRFIPFSVNTNTGRIGINTTNANTVSVDVNGLPAATNLTGNGGTATTTGRIRVTAGAGGASFMTTTASGGSGGAIQITSGIGGEVPFATTNATGGSGGNFFLNGGVGNVGALATNSITGGIGGSFSLQAGAGGSSSFATTQAVAGAGGAFQIFGGQSASPSGGWSRKTSAGGAIDMTAGVSGDSTRTNSGDGGSITLTAGKSGNVLTSPGDPGNAGNISFLAGGGGSGGTNANGGNIYAAGGTGAISGDVVIGRISGGTSRGGLMVGPALGGAASITNILGGSAVLDFGSVAAGTVEDLPITVTGVTSNNCAVALSVAWQVLTANGGVFTTYNSNDVVYVRFANNNLVTAIDPIPFTATVVAFRIR